jgi:hypothetical protein
VSTPEGMSCPICGARIARQQDWCLECGTGARTRMVPTPNWRLPIATLIAVIAIAGAALAVALVSLTNDTSTTQTITTPATTPPATTAPTG